MTIDWGWVLIIAGALLILIEVALGGFAGFDLVLIGSAFMVGGAVGKWTHDTRLGLLVASALCALYIVAGRRWVRSRLKVQHTASNADAVLGRAGLVTARIDTHHAGQVKVQDETWRALPAAGVAVPIEPGTEVKVESLDGVTLLVRR
jgi:membrane protein implicated in regulation of membrane protease activity